MMIISEKLGCIGFQISLNSQVRGYVVFVELTKTGRRKRRRYLDKTRLLSDNGGIKIYCFFTGSDKDIQDKQL